MTKSLAKRDPAPEYGPAMRALHPKWRRAVEALFVSDGDRSKALRMAGYDGKAASINVMASRIFGDDRVRAAIREECTKRIDNSEPELLAIASQIMRNPGEKASDRLRAVAMVWDRANPIMTRHKIEVEHHMTGDERDIRHYRALEKLGAPRDAFIARFGPNGIARVEALIRAEDNKYREAEVIDADYEDVTPPASVSPQDAPQSDDLELL